ncbi:hypothetical protein NliqN6_3878 [Naganishia liquefaciens]|uniref:YetF C-terminal domain-containing protein n=1 Tax=Naganishia liquefaciens TaxID=104408 RepID=A0A8H3YHB1_9TREE|nr:hypothetical protein NliqN6_3878 [Naganishia liquefaciens]
MGAPVIQKSDFYIQESVLHPITAGAIAFAFLYVYLRIASNRSLAPNDIVTWISSVAIGSTLSRITTNTNIDLVRGLLSLLLFLVVDFVLTFGMVRSKKLETLIRGQPLLCVFRGQVLEKTCHSNRVERASLLASLRSHGLVSFDQVDCIVLETTGVFSVIPKFSLLDQPDATVLLCQGVPGYQELLEQSDKEACVSDSTLSPAAMGVPYRPCAV